MNRAVKRSYPFIWVAILTLVTASIMFYSSFTGRIMAERYAPLVDAAMEIKLEATIAHLWFEELISGDRTVAIEDVWEHLDQVEWYARAMLEGGENPEGRFVPLEDDTLRRKIEKTLDGISSFRAIAHERWKARSQSGVGSDIDQRFDKVFNDLLVSADEVETTLQQVMRRHLQRFRALQGLLLAIVVILGVVIGVVLQRYERRRTNDMLALRDKEENLRITFDSIGDAVIVTDTGGRIVRMNPVAERLTGWRFEEVRGKALLEVFNIVNAKTKEPASDPVKRVLENGKIVGLANHTMLIARDGAEYQIADSAAPIRGDNGILAGVVLVFRDVTEEYRMQEKIRTSEKQLRSLYDSMTEGVCQHEVVYNESGKAVDYRIIDTNIRYEEILHLNRNDVIGKLATEVYATDEAPYLNSYVEVAETGKPFQFETYFPLMDKHFSIMAFSPGKGKFATVFEDITERRQAEEIRARISAQLEAKNKELEQVLFVASHDLRSPLVNIDGYSRELQHAIDDLRSAFSGDQTPTEAIESVTPLLEHDLPEALRFIRTSASKMDALLAGLLKLSRSGRSNLTIDSLDMNELISKVVDASEFQIKQTGVELHITDLPPCKGDAILVNQVFSNLLGNALKYLDPERRGVIRISGTIEGKRCVYCVEDNGIGIAPAHCKNIFEIFHQLDPANSEGEGLGLTIVQQTLGRLLGDIWVESKPGEGSNFYVALPTIKKNR